MKSRTAFSSLSFVTLCLVIVPLHFSVAFAIIRFCLLMILIIISPLSDISFGSSFMIEGPSLAFASSSRSIPQFSSLASSNSLSRACQKFKISSLLALSCGPYAFIILIFSPARQICVTNISILSSPVLISMGLRFSSMAVNKPPPSPSRLCSNI